ncbi:putative ribonuclease H-like domain-containing protein [Tanacetum coccineum]|uniref:Ribonuclease H-like domain-containing protein n=1 Tax=Tanacetum coccineum TaxID=301880 RepID=A0ABQ4Y685_9ASTR
MSVPIPDPPMLDKAAFASWQHVFDYTVGIKEYNAGHSANKPSIFKCNQKISSLINHIHQCKGHMDKVKCFWKDQNYKEPGITTYCNNDFEHFRQNKGETIHDYYVRFAKLINDMRNIKMTMSKIQLNSKFVNNMLLEWGRFVTAVKLNKGLKDSNFDQLGQATTYDKGFVDSGCQRRHMTGNIAYHSISSNLMEGYGSFGGVAYGCLTDVLQKNYVLNTDTECLVLSLNFKLPDENQILLKIPRKDNMYSFDIKNNVPKESLTCLVAKATLDESMLWHRRLGKQHRASCKSKVLNPITKPLFMLHMDLFGPTFVSSLMHKKYCLVVTDDYSRFTWVFFLTTKDETSEILKNFIKEIENLVDKKVKIIRSDNGTEFKNKVMDDFCREKGIKREYSVARTPQQNGVAERRNRTLIEAARTMLADSKLPTTFWAEAVSTTCYVQNRVLVVKPHNKTPYELFRAFRVYNTRTRRVEENLHIGFLENKPMIEGNGPKWLFDIDSLTQSMNYVPVAAGTLEENNQDCIVMPIWKDTSYLDSPYKECCYGENQKLTDDAQKHVEDVKD